MMNKFHFPNGIQSYLETFYEVSQFFQRHEDHPALVEVNEKTGKDGVLLLAISIANEFELNIRSQLAGKDDVPFQEALIIFISFKLKDAL